MKYLIGKGWVIHQSVMPSAESKAALFITLKDKFINFYNLFQISSFSFMIPVQWKSLEVLVGESITPTF